MANKAEEKIFGNKVSQNTETGANEENNNFLSIHHQSNNK